MVSPLTSLRRAGFLHKTFPMTPLLLAPALGQFGNFFVVILAVAVLIFHCLLMNCVSDDANRRRAAGKSLVILTPRVWAFGALLMGLLAVAFYWLCHYSRFARRED
jgi:small-conductance mechanosensitive channel